MKEKDLKIQEYKQKMEKYKKRLQRLRKNTKNNNKNDETLNTKLTRMCDPPATRKDVVKMALFGEVLNEQLKENYTGLKTQREKDIFGRVVSGARIEKYKLCRTQDSAITYETLQKATNQSLLPTKRTLLALISSENMKTVQNFYENNENSRVGARKREFVTRNEVNKQKRYSLDTMGNLYKRFKSNKSGLISYQTFCCLHPFWVRCVNKNPDYIEFDDSKAILFKKWTIEKKDYKDPKLNKVRFITKYVKKSLTVRPRELIQKLHEELDAYYNHERNILHQNKALNKLKENLNDNEVSGHGKSAADGVGATCKRSAYVIVATGGDIDSLESFIDSVQQRYPAITIFKIDDNAINNMTNDIQKDAKNLKSFICTLRCTSKYIR
ncbi:hypothetical protein PV328_012143 [Microctonus aethiopoides]|uniref:Uncharacterized protein n=1 Tax=Microctonus aethiopoides TaxID=144406 RepID=A0AA39FH27_9HYME|nr:hypothetical protein PV328_012143 [Microctonus aethiopoides]